MLIAVRIMLYISILNEFASAMEVFVELNANEMQCKEYQKSMPLLVVHSKNQDK